MLSRILIAVVLLSTALLAWHFGLFEYLTIDQLRSLNQRLGYWAPIAFVVAFVIGELLQVPSIFWILCAGLIWPFWIAFPLSMLSAVLAATVAFLVARHILGDRFHEKLPAGFDALAKALKRAPLKAVIMIRLTTFIHPVVHWVLGASPIRLPVFLLGTAIGIFPGVLAIVLLGQTFVSWWDEYAYWIVGAGIAVVLGYVAFQRRKKQAVPL
jgi:uncharacterized membrane protein YdjX (TVP38/TMEM64 family)